MGIPTTPPDESFSTADLISSVNICTAIVKTNTSRNKVLRLKNEFSMKADRGLIYRPKWIHLAASHGSKCMIYFA